MEYGFMQCCTNKGVIRIPVKKLNGGFDLYLAEADEKLKRIGSFNISPVDMPLSDELELYTQRVPNGFYWALINNGDELTIDDLPSDTPLNYIYDSRTGFIHLIYSGERLPVDYFEYNPKLFFQTEFKGYYSPFKFGVDEGAQLVEVASAFKNKWFSKKKYNHNIGVVTSWNTKCGIAEYVKQVVSHFDFNYTILALKDDNTIAQDDKNVKRCFDPNNIEELKKTIKENNIDHIWIHYSYSWFNEYNFSDLIQWCKDNHISYSVFAHSQLRTEDMVAICNEYSSGRPEHGKYIPIAPPDYVGGIIPRKNTIGSFGFAHPHKNFEEPFEFLKRNKKIHYYIWTSHGVGEQGRIIGDKYIEFLRTTANKMGVGSRVHINVGFLDEKELLDNLASCWVLGLFYKDIPTENQSAAVSFLRATGRPVITSSSAKLKGFGDASIKNATEELEYWFKNVSVLEKSASIKKSEYTKSDEFYRHLGDIKPYGGTGIIWYGDVTHVKSFSVVGRKWLEILYNWGVKISLCPDKVDFVLEDEEEFVQEMIRTEPDDSMIKTGLAYPPLFSYAHAPVVAWETDKGIPEWLKMSKDITKKTIVISNFVKDALVRSGFNPDLVDVVNLGCSNYYYNYNKKNVYEVSNQVATERPFTFLNIAWAEPRKGTDILIRAYNKAFTKKDNVVLVLKTIKKNKWLNDLVKHFETNNSPKIIVIEGDQYNLNDIYMSTDVYVHPLRGEGFGLPVLEAQAFGVPNIVTGWGGPLDFTDNDTSWYIDYDLVPAEYHHEVKGARWAEPNCNHLVSLMRHAYKNKRCVQEKGLNAYKKSLEFSWHRSAYQFLESIHGVKL